VSFTYRNGREAGVLSIVESLGGGVGMCDYDRDGQMDLILPGGGQFGPGEQLTGRPTGLFRQIQPFQFSDVSTVSGLAPSRYYTHGCTIGDYDNDGFHDVLITGYGGLQLFQNLGDGTFREVQQQAQLTDSLWSSSAGWGDVNNDGALDLYVAHYADWSWTNNPPCFSRPDQRDVCPPRSFRGLDDILYLSNGDGTFRDASQELGLRSGGKGLGVLLADLDLDADVDIYVCNDTEDNFLYVNQGQGQFEESGVLAGVATDDRGVANGSMGVATLDFNGDLRPDVWVANFENESFALYRNDGMMQFTHVSGNAGIFTLGPIYVGFGTAAGDLDRDGDEDLLVANGHVVYFPQSGRLQQLPLLLMNDQGRFQRANYDPSSYFGQAHHGRGLALGDIDNDGDLDGVFSNNNEATALQRNDTPATGHWIGVQLIGTKSSRDAIGASVVLHTNQGDSLRSCYGGGSYLSQNDSRMFWGLPVGMDLTEITIHWPGGKTSKTPIDRLDRYITVHEP
jgi:hypothetical protein